MFLTCNLYSVILFTWFFLTEDQHVGKKKNTEIERYFLVMHRNLSNPVKTCKHLDWKKVIYC